jgi:hypothetical protein
MNLHQIVRGPINAVNPDLYGTWMQSTGPTSNADFTRSPVFTTFTNVQMQVQPMSSGDLYKTNFLNAQKVTRAVYMYGDPQGVVRVDAKGGDELVFPQILCGPNYTWLVYAVLEPWTSSVGNGGWSKVAVVLQDPA